MPYTPPSQRSPASSATSSPDVSRRPSIQAQSGGPRPSLPRSSSYMVKHRRTPSAVDAPVHQVDQITPEPTMEDMKGMLGNSSIRQSPPPVTDERALPKGVIISPPESPNTSDDDDLPEVRGRRIENLKELHEAISQIPQHRASSPSRGETAKREEVDAGDLLVLPSQAGVISEGMHHSFSTSALDDLAAGHRRISHSRSVTEPNLITSKSAGNSLTGSEEDSDDDPHRKPSMVRKKSGELVRPALRPPAMRRPSSAPGTPTFSKAVHFDSHLEHVRHFLQVDRPLAVSAGSSPIDNYDSDNEYPFSVEDKAPRAPPFEWEITASNFPTDTPARRARTVRLERIWLSSDQKNLLGSVIVENIAFQKYVTCRFTLDYWKTVSEVAADYQAEVRPQEGPRGHDRFHFTIKLSDLANLETKTLFFCIRYNALGQEFWDNNDGTNFQVDFRKKMLPAHGKKGTIGAASRPANNLPRSTRRPTTSGGSRSKHTAGTDEFGTNSNMKFDQSLHEYLGESSLTPLRLKTPKTAANLASDSLSNRLPTPSGQAFSNRYDFGASLTAAVQAAKGAASAKIDRTKEGVRRPVESKQGPGPQVVSGNAVSPKDKLDNAVAETAPVPGVGSPSASLSSSSYEELVNKYCFFGSKQSSPQLQEGTLRSGRYDGADEGQSAPALDSPSSSENGSPLEMGVSSRMRGGTLHSSQRRKDCSPYFGQAMGSSPAGVSTSEPQRWLHPSRQQPGSPISGTFLATSMGSGQALARSLAPAGAVANFPSYAAIRG